jgi:carbon storage regulator CsrA
MLVITRKNKEKIFIGDNITVTVLRVRGNRISLGFEAPDDVRVLRGELRRGSQVAANRTGDPGGLSKRAKKIVASLIANSELTEQRSSEPPHLATD